MQSVMKRAAGLKFRSTHYEIYRPYTVYYGVRNYCTS